MKLKLIQMLLVLSASLLWACGGDQKAAADSSATTETELESQNEETEVIEETAISENQETEEETQEEAIVIEEEEDTEENVEEDSTETEDRVDPEQLKKADEIIASVSEEDVSAIDTKKLFRMHCAICHGFKGNMMVNGAKDLTKSKISLTESVAQVYYGKGLMTPYNGVLKDEEIVALAKYVEGFRK